MAHDVHDTDALRADVVAGHSLSAAALLALPDEAAGYELIQGRLVHLAPTGAEHGLISAEVNAALRSYVGTHGLGRVFGAETGFLVSKPGAPDTVLAPDAAFVRAERLPPRSDPAWKTFLPLAPDLIVEVVSPSHNAPEMAEMARLWLSAGVRLIWVIWPASQHVDVWRSRADAPTATLNTADALDGVDVLPGFSMPVADLFG